MDTTALELSALTVHSPSSQCRVVMKRILLEKANGVSHLELFPGLLKLITHPDPVVKKTLYSLLQCYAKENPDLALLAVNTLVQECDDSNPMTRGLALKTLCSLNHPTFIEYGIRGVNRAISDRSAYVRRIAITCCARFYQQDVDLYNDSSLINHLYNAIRDSDPIVVTNAVMVLEDVLKKEGGIVISKKMAHHLLNKLNDMTSWGQSYIFKILLKYRPKTEDETFDIINLLDPFLTHNSCIVVTICLQLFLHFVTEMSHLRAEVFKRSMPSIVAIFASGNHELILLLIKFLENYLEEMKLLLQPHHQVFFSKQKEPVYLKQKKLTIVSKFVNDQNFKEIIEEISLHSAETDCDVSLCAINAIGEVLQREPSSAPLVMLKFKHLLESDSPHVVTNTLNVLQSVDLRLTENASEIVSLVASKCDMLSDSNGKMAFLHLLSQYGDLLPESPYIAEEFVDSFTSETDSLVKVQILTTVTKLFFHHPAACQGILGRILEMCMLDENRSVHDQAQFYYNLLSCDVGLAQSIIM